MFDFSFGYQLMFFNGSVEPASDLYRATAVPAADDFYVDENC